MHTMFKREEHNSERFQPSHELGEPRQSNKDLSTEQSGDGEQVPPLPRPDAHDGRQTHIVLPVSS